MYQRSKSNSLTTRQHDKMCPPQLFKSGGRWHECREKKKHVERKTRHADSCKHEKVVRVFLCQSLSLILVLSAVVHDRWCYSALHFAWVRVKWCFTRRGNRAASRPHEPHREMTKIHLQVGRGQSGNHWISYQLTIMTTRKFWFRNDMLPVITLCPHFSKHLTSFIIKRPTWRKWETFFYSYLHSSTKLISSAH